MPDPKTPTRQVRTKKATRRATTVGKIAAVRTPRTKRAAVKKAASIPVVLAAPPTQKQIATRAYFLWQGGGQDPVANWNAAEQELQSVA
jgi:hypothetical protein